MNRVDGKIALITGGARGIGGEAARQLVQAGANVAITDVLVPDGEALTSELGNGSIFLQHDVTDEAAWKHVVGKTVSQFGGLDILVNNAGVWERSVIEEASVEQFDRLCAVNLKGVFLGTKHGINAMKNRPMDADSASIINLSSTAGLVGSSTSAIYSMTKGGVRLFTKSTAIEVRARGYNIRCNSVHPGATESAMQNDILATSNMTAAEIETHKTTRTPMGLSLIHI